MNIILFTFSKTDSYGNFVYPRYSQMYIHPKKINRKTAIIILYPVEKYEYQCEIVIQYAKKGKNKIRFVFESPETDDFILKIYDLQKLSNTLISRD